MTQPSHFILVGDTPLSRSTYRELQSRQQSILVLLSSEPDENFFHPEDVLVGDASDTDILRQAGIETAEAILALRADDSENAFVILAAKELHSRAKTVAAVNDSKNHDRVMRVEPDYIVSPQVMGSQILAMALDGEELSGQRVSEMFASQKRSAA